MDNYSLEMISETVEKQRCFFNSGKTLDVEFRIRQLKRLKKAVIYYEDELTHALFKDLGRNVTEGYFCDVGSVILEINEMIAGLRKWSKPETHYSGIHCFPSVITKIYKMPYGVTLIISPFNFPIILSFGVLAASIAGGNTAIIKASSKSANCTKVMQKIIAVTFPEKYISVIGGGHDVADMCLTQKIDKIFYTGSPNVGKLVLEKASKNLTPVALELGAENGNWCILRKDADIKDAARKIAFFKILNSGQICIDINQVAVAKEIAEPFIKQLCKEFTRQLGENPITNPEYPHLINKSAYIKCANKAEKYRERIVYGGKGNENSLKYSPTVIYPVNINEEIVQKELFSPLLPIVVYEDAQINKLLDTISDREKSLALYIFTKNIKWAKKVMQRLQFGGGCINEVCLHMMVKGAPFNGVGHSGMGAYHGEWGFREFTHPQSVLIGSNHFNLSIREHPYGKKCKKKLIQLLER